MIIAILVEGRTERAFMDALRRFLQPRLAGRMPNLDPLPYDGRIPTGDKLKRTVDRLLNGRRPADAVIALTDVYTGTRDFSDATDAKRKMQQWVGDRSEFHPHAALHDFEAWLLPYWDTILRLAKHNANPPSGSPEAINHSKPPAHHLAELFERGKCRDSYQKPRDAKRILRDADLLISANACPELKAFLNTILTLSGGSTIP